jgi:hypothetical protein
VGVIFGDGLQRGTSFGNEAQRWGNSFGTEAYNVAGTASTYSDPKQRTSFRNVGPERGTGSALWPSPGNEILRCGPQREPF